MEILSAKELYQKGEIDAIEYQNPRLFGNRMVLKFSDQREALRFVYAFVHQYLIPKYGKEGAAKFPLVKTGPARELGETLGIVPKVSPEIWFTIPEDRFNEVEEFLNNWMQ